MCGSCGKDWSPMVGLIGVATGQPSELVEGNLEPEVSLLSGGFSRFSCRFLWLSLQWSGRLNCTSRNDCEWPQLGSATLNLAELTCLFRGKTPFLNARRRHFLPIRTCDGIAGAEKKRRVAAHAA